MSPRILLKSSAFNPHLNSYKPYPRTLPPYLLHTLSTEPEPNIPKPNIRFRASWRFPTPQGSSIDGGASVSVAGFGFDPSRLYTLFFAFNRTEDDDASNTSEFNLTSDDDAVNTFEVSSPYSLHPTPYTLHPTLCTLHSTPYTLRPKPSTLNPTPSTSNPQPERCPRPPTRAATHP